MRSPLRATLLWVVWLLVVSAAHAATPVLTTEGVPRTGLRIGYAATQQSVAQSVTAPAGPLGALCVALARHGTPPPLTVTVTPDAGPPLVSQALDPGAISTNVAAPTWTCLSFPAPVELVAGAPYRVTLATATTSTAHFWLWATDNKNPYPGGAIVGASFAAYDALLRLYAESLVPPPPPPDADADGFPDTADACPTVAGVAPDGCPHPPPMAPATLTPTLGWPDLADNEDDYQVERKPPTGDYAVIATLPPNTTAYADPAMGAEACYRVQARNQYGGGSGYSPELCVRMTAAPPPPPPPPVDTDGDGVTDDIDACPTVAGIAPDGCPAPPPPPPGVDTDGDGIPDATDACPTVAGVPPTGCPAPPPPPPPTGTGPTTTPPLEWVRTLPVSGAARDTKRLGSTLYVSTTTGLSIFDVTVPDAPRLYASVGIGDCNGVAVEGTTAYLACAARFAIVDVAVPQAPRILYNCAPTTANQFCGGVFREAGNLRDVAVKDGVAYVASWHGRVLVLDAATPAAPTLIRSWGVSAITAGTAMNQTTFDSYASLRDYIGNGAATGISVYGNRLIVTEWKYGHAHVYDVTDARAPVYLGGHGYIYSLDTVTNGVYMYSMQAYASQSGLSSTRLPPLTGSLEEKATSPGTCAPDCAFLRTLWVSLDQGSLTLSRSGVMAIYAGGKHAGTLEVIDVSAPATPVSVAQGRLTTGADYGTPMAFTVGVATAGDVIYVGAGTAGVQVYRYPDLEVFTPKPILRAQPSTGFTAQGAPGGPFTPASAAYALDNVGQLPLTWHAAATQPWLSVTPATGTLTPGDRVVVTVALTAAATALVDGAYTDSITFTTETGIGSTTRPVSLSVRRFALMQVLPTKAESVFQSNGPPGGPFAPSVMTYTVKNLGNLPLDWSATLREEAPWVQWSSLGGTLAGGASTTVTATVDPAVAAAMPGGGYAATVDFLNLTSGTFRAADGGTESGPTDRTLNLNVLAFGQGAYEGFGTITHGGEGGALYEVTTLADTGPGSLREGLKLSNRRIVFRVAGLIHSALDYLYITGHNLTVSGETAPGAGLSIDGKSVVCRGNRGCHDLIWTGTRFRTPAIDAFTMDGGACNIILDHNSFHGAPDGDLDLGTNAVCNVTVSNNLIHGAIGEGKNSLMAYGVNRITLKSNLYSGYQRNPQIRHDDGPHGDGSGGSPAPWITADMVNNIVRPLGSGTFVRWWAKVNIIANWFIPRQASPDNALTVVGPGTEVYVSGNGSSLPQWNPNNPATYARNGGVVSLTQPLSAAPVTIRPAHEAACDILAHAGPRPLDAIDQALIDEVRGLIPACP